MNIWYLRLIFCLVIFLIISSKDICSSSEVIVGILRVIVTIIFSNRDNGVGSVNNSCCLVAKSCLTLVTPWTIAHQALLSMGFPRQEYCRAWVTQSCPTLCDPVDCGPPGSSDHGIPQARMLEWVEDFFSREPFWPLANTAATYGKGWSQVQLKYKRRRGFSFLMVVKSQIEISIAMREISVTIFAA